MTSTELDRIEVDPFVVRVCEVVDGDPGTSGAPVTIMKSYTVSIESGGGKIVSIAQSFVDGADAQRAMMLAVVGLRLGLPRED